MDKEKDLEPEADRQEPEKEKEKKTLLKMVEKNRAAALGFAVLIAANALLSSCASHPKNPNSAYMQKTYQQKVEKDEYGVDDRNTYYGHHYGGGYHSYYHWGPHPIFSSPYGTGYYHSSGWGAPPSHFSGSGYAMSRGGSLGS